MTVARRDISSKQHWILYVCHRDVSPSHHCIAQEADERLREQVGNLGSNGSATSTRMPKEEADRRKAVAKALRSELRLANEVGNLVSVSDVGPAVARRLAPVRERLMGLHKELTLLLRDTLRRLP